MTDSTIVRGFHALRAEQRLLASKVAELEADLSEHRLVFEALNQMNGNRKCFRLIGGVLVERSVKEVKPSLENNQKMIESLVESLKSQIVEKGVSIAQYVEKHNLRVRVADQ